MLELLLANHPLDCPVCDKGGECPLQDQAFSHGPGESRYVEQKRHYEKPIPISDHVLLDRERCILCDRCTRFADEVAGDKLIHFIDRGNVTQVNTFPDEPFSSYFSGNTVQICPVGALTAKPYRFKARPWDLEQVESTCTTCSVGCRISVHSSRDELLRYQGVDTARCRFGQLGLAVRPRSVQLRVDRVRSTARRPDGPRRRRPRRRRRGTRGDGARPPAARRRRPRSACSAALAAPTRTRSPGRSSPTRSVSTMRDAQLGDGLPAEVLGLPRATIDEAAERGDGDPARTRPQGRAAGAVPAAPRRSRAGPHQDHRVLVAGDGYVPLRVAQRPPRARHGGPPRSPRTLADPAVAAQIASGDVVVVAGRGNLAVSEATQRWRRSAPRSTPYPTPRCCRRCGAATSSVRSSSASPRSSADHDALATLRAAADGKLDLLVLLGADPINDCPDADLARRAHRRRTTSHLDRHVSRPSRRSTPTSCCRRPASARRREPRPISKAASPASARRSPPTARRGPTG